ncbi:hypothetical protein [uncultured Cohaesibacter sp.]|uniref:hypothetical protein n=1 Tax=uncultured Cohaesibacter sp. TaxID=1002546 RepID=UPI0029C60DAB|nr:hypothetical protein [uncultured Cohaesibacter sp.]
MNSASIRAHIPTDEATANANHRQKKQGDSSKAMFSLANERTPMREDSSSSKTVREKLSISDNFKAL